MGYKLIPHPAHLNAVILRQTAPVRDFEDYYHRRLAMAVIAQGIRDLASPTDIARDAALEFVNSAAFVFWCDVAHLSEKNMRRQLAERGLLPVV